MISPLNPGQVAEKKLSCRSGRMRPQMESICSRKPSESSRLDASYLLDAPRRAGVCGDFFAGPAASLERGVRLHVRGKRRIGSPALKLNLPTGAGQILCNLYVFMLDWIPFSKVLSCLFLRFF